MTCRPSVCWSEAERSALFVNGMPRYRGDCDMGDRSGTGSRDRIGGYVGMRYASGPCSCFLPTSRKELARTLAQ